MSGPDDPVFPDHEGKATWGGRLVPLERFQDEVSAQGRRLAEIERTHAERRFVEAEPDGIAVEGPYERVLVFGGVYNNAPALEALLDTPDARDADAIYCLGDLGGFGPSPDKVRPLLESGEVRSIQGNYEESLAAGHDDCNCGYTDPRDNRFAEISYRYTAERCNPSFKNWMGTLPRRRRIRVGKKEWLLVHGSPRRINEFLFQSTSPVPFLEVLLAGENCDGLLFTHTGLPWMRDLPSGRTAMNVGVIGRPANDGDARVRYAVIEQRRGGEVSEVRKLAYDHQRLADEMRSEKLPEEFVETILTGWWTTCLEILPAAERARSRY